ncbi:hypothetical protein [Rhodoferax sp.]|uniref:hypothetical protein n=1 Tax=Rhodoferax sp. TaxID=50421 RepID=UPI0025E804C2|nr:hypothetical protein [Rhodoferax sp.]
MTGSRVGVTLLVCWGWLFVPALAQDASQVQQQSITAERSRAEADFARQEQACYDRFVVQSCLDQVAAKRRVLERELKRQEASLNAAQRQQRAQEQLQRSAEKAREREAPVAEQPDATAERLLAQHEKQEAHRQVSPPSMTASKPTAVAPSLAEQAALRDAYAAKQRAAQERRAARDKRLRDSKEARPALPQPQ